MPIDQQLIKAINELAYQNNKTPVFRSMPGLPDFQWDAQASGFTLPTSQADIDALAAAFDQRMAAQPQPKVPQGDGGTATPA